jgi:hypothetical protein
VLVESLIDGLLQKGKARGLGLDSKFLKSSWLVGGGFFSAAKSKWRKDGAIRPHPGDNNTATPGLLFLRLYDLQPFTNSMTVPVSKDSSSDNRVHNQYAAVLRTQPMRPWSTTAPARRSELPEARWWAWSIILHASSLHQQRQLEDQAFRSLPL